MATGAAQAPPAPIVSTIKLRAAGFHEYADTEDMFVKWFRALRRQRLLP